ncbi:hypothetical protein MSMTP_0068 [Methanosarcina sp. MTP4]|uniref:hypothetical protein n=1 Tax=Methanosarcina sp. MTP4 TaxID=1434100 RepID=UPI0006157FD1|nr:hypothetical protein [Methanosarcina sp. MTP4]AKB23537.1 hypothetical protein MSMTP_0068 [Methanosarcina sp. MTP4]
MKISSLSAISIFVLLSVIFGSVYFSGCISLGNENLVGDVDNGTEDKGVANEGGADGEGGNLSLEANPELNETGFGQSSPGNLSETGGDGIIPVIGFDKSLLEIPESCDYVAAIIINPVKFNKSAANGTVNLSLMGEDFELKLHETDYPTSKTTYAGYITGKPQSNVFFSVGEDSISGSIVVDFYTLSYGIRATDEMYDGKVVHLVWVYRHEDMKEKLEQEYSLDPLQFFLSNSDKEGHEIRIELLDFHNEPVFNGTYSLNPGDEVASPEINVELGNYRYEITLDGQPPFEQKVRADYATELGSSEKLYINLIDHPEYPMEIGIEVA